MLRIDLGLFRVRLDDHPGSGNEARLGERHGFLTL
jgi:hypothetical protein